MTVRDEVCGMEFRAREAAESVEYQGRVYYFCAPRCRLLFERNPHWYVPILEVPDLQAEQGPGPRA